MGQQRILTHLSERCATFVLDARARSLTTDHACDISKLVLDAYTTPSNTDGKQSTTLATSGEVTQQGDSSTHTLSLPAVSAFSSAPTAVVPLIATRASLPEQLRIIPFLDLLPPDIAAAYSESESHKLLRSPTEVLFRDHLHPLPTVRVAGERHEYVALLKRMLTQGMIRFTSRPKAVNGIFAVAKDVDSDRVIIDARQCNRLFKDSPHVALPGPSHLVQMHVPKGAIMFMSKSDLSNFYHHLGVPEWLQPYFALPPLTSAELASLGLSSDNGAYPMCLTVPMGWLLAVYVAQCVHQHIIYSRNVVRPEHSLLCLRSPSVTNDSVLHGIVIDDFFIFSLNLELAQATIDAALEAYRAAGLVVKMSKVVMPTSSPVKVIGFDIDGTHSTITLPAKSQSSLVQSTVAVLRSKTVTGSTLAHVIGRWTWVMMLRRSTLAVLQQCYRFIRVAQGRRFNLWPSVRRELCMLLSLLPLLHARLDVPYFHRVIASDASELGGGVVSTSLTPQLHSDIWPLCSTRHHAVQQSKLNASRIRSLGLDPIDTASLQPDLLASAATSKFDYFYSVVEASRWRTIVSVPWSGAEHINALELRAALLAVHWALRYPSAMHTRAYLLLDSTVAFFTLWKGRSSSPALLLILRKISALLLASGLSLLPGWVPSAVNPADNPSRLIHDCSTSSRIAA